MKLSSRILPLFVLSGLSAAAPGAPAPKAAPAVPAPKAAAARPGASGRIAADLSKALDDLAQTRRENSAMRRDLYREINELDDRALKLGKELRALEHEEELRESRRRRLEGEVKARKVEMDYVTGVLQQYSQALLTRLHPAENQRYEEPLETAGRRAEAASGNLVGELSERLSAARIGLERLSAVAGGERFTGKALRNGSETLQGNFALYGPAVFFAADGGFEGVATFAQSGTELPTVVALQSVKQGSVAETISKGSGTLPFDASMGKALEVAAARESLVEIAEKGGVVGYAILLLGAVAIGITLFKIFEISRFPVPSRRQVNEIIDDLLAERQDQAQQRAAGLRGMSGEMIRVGITLFYEKRRILEEALFEKLVAIKPRLDRFLPFLGLTAAAAPLMGLLGTVLGIIKTFKAMAIYGTGNAKSFSAGISEALITTAEGLVVAIPVLVFHGMMKSYAKAKFGEVESLGVSMMNGTSELGKSKTPAPDDDGEEDDGDFALDADAPQPA